MPRAGKTRAPPSFLGESRCNAELCPPVRMEPRNLRLSLFRSARTVCGIRFADRMDRIRLPSTMAIIVVTLLLLHPGKYIPRKRKNSFLVHSLRRDSSTLVLS